jgi:hypothetical protein
MRTSSSKPATSATRSAYRSSEFRVDQNWAYWADSRRVDRRASFWTDSTKSEVLEAVVSAVGKGWVWAGRRARQREKAGEGKTVRALARMLVTVSGWRR